MVRIEGDRQMTSPGAPVRQPLQSRPEGGSASTVVVEHNTVTRYVATVRGHEVRVDQPLAAGGTDEAPTPVELFVVSLATCVAYYDTSSVTA
jgi:putative redox protein